MITFFISICVGEPQIYIYIYIICEENRLTATGGYTVNRCQIVVISRWFFVFDTVIFCSLVFSMFSFLCSYCLRTTIKYSIFQKAKIVPVYRRQTLPTFSWNQCDLLCSPSCQPLNYIKKVNVCFQYLFVI